MPIDTDGGPDYGVRHDGNRNVDDDEEFWTSKNLAENLARYKPNILVRYSILINF